MGVGGIKWEAQAKFVCRVCVCVFALGGGERKKMGPCFAVSLILQRRFENKFPCGGGTRRASGFEVSF